jgi:hypothetical protein
VERVYHAPTVRASALFFALVVAFAAPPAFAQSAGDPTEPTGEGDPNAPQTSTGSADSGGWRFYQGERHILVRAQVGLGFRLNDPYRAGTLTPIAPYLQGSYQFLHVGQWLMGPSMGFQVGLDSIGAQYAIQPGWQVIRRFSGRFALTGRVEVPILITQGACASERTSIDMRSGIMGRGHPSNQLSLPVPSLGFCPAVSLGVEAAVGAALYVTSGVAITGEAVFSFYSGDSLIPFPILGASVGVMVDYEVLP